MATIIFDFDHTLFDAHNFGKTIKEMFLKNGVPERIVEKTHKEQRKENKDNPDLIDQVERMKELGYKIKESDIDEFFRQNLEKFLKGPVKDILDKLKKKGHRLMLLTKGVEYFQRFKIRQSGVAPFFNGHVYICDEKKEELLKDIPAKGKTYFVDDHADEIEAVMKKYPEMNFVYVKEPETTHYKFVKNMKIPMIDEISELPKLIRQ